MRVKLRTLMSGPKGTYHPGQTADLAQHIAQDLINGGFALAVDQLPRAPEPRKRPKPEHDDE